jgi:tRNA/tmRNA/rRNA uracil-C5-methylase (TrmA/RlmC/RlmD family)
MRFIARCSRHRAATLQALLLVARHSPLRMGSSNTLSCAHFDQCDGCVLSKSVDEPPLLAEARAFFNSHAVALRVAAGEPTGWRTTARLAVRATAGGGARTYHRLECAAFSRGAEGAVVQFCC